MPPNSGWLDQAGKAVTILAQLAAVAGVYILLDQTHSIAEQTRIATQQYTSSVRGSMADRTSAWLDHMKEHERWNNFRETLGYLSSRAASDSSKLARLNNDRDFEGKVMETLAFLEDFGYVYNAGLVDNQMVSHGPSGAILQYYNASGPWIARLRRTNGAGLYRELERMATALCADSDVRGSAPDLCLNTPPGRVPERLRK